MLQIYDTLTKKKLTFKPLVPGKVGIYACGVTVYDYSHIGHARGMVVFDMVARFFRFRGFDVTYVRNITDIDDKIIKRANERGVPIETITKTYIDALHEDVAALNILPVDIEPKATDHIDTIIEMIQTLLDKGYAYVANSGDICYEIAKFKTYGELAHQDINSLRAGARVEVDSQKNDPLDFVLWKKAKPGEPAWDSPWGQGRPGWHIECSAMTKRCLGDTFDIHGGGMDLPFPHHQNEIAQSEAANGCKYVNTWMHVGFVNVNREKMSKSLGNFFTIREVLEQYDSEVIRYFMLASHYRSPINYSTDNLDSAQAALERFYLSLRGLDLTDTKPLEKTDFEKRFFDAMEDDFNTPEAIAVLFYIAREINRLKEGNEIESAKANGATLLKLASILGILSADPEAFLQGDDKDSAKISALIEKRNNARSEKDWALSDKIRDELHGMGIELEDSAKGTIWRRIHWVP